MLTLVGKGHIMQILLSLRIERAAEAMALDADQIRALDRPTAWAYIWALEGLAGNTDTDPRWQRASEIREICC